MHRLSLALCCISLWLAAGIARADIEVILYTPFEFEPFVIDKGAKSGLIYSLTQALNDRGRGLYHFTLRVAPRIPGPRLIQAQEVSLVPFAAPEWFDDPDMKTFAWSKPLLHDRTIIISHVDAPIESLEAKVLKGKRTVVLPVHHQDPEIKKLMAQGVIASDPSPALLNALLMIARKRDDFLITGRLLSSYLIKLHNLAGDLHLSTLKNSEYKMRILVNHRAEGTLLSWLNQQIDELAKDPAWNEALNVYMPLP